MSNKRAHSDGRILPEGVPGKAAVSKRTPKESAPSPRKGPPSAPPDPLTKLRARLKTAEETLRAIQSGEVDALMVAGPRGDQVISLKGGEHS